MITIDTVIDAVAEAYKVDRNTLIGTAQPFGRPRTVAIWICRRLLEAEPPAIAAAFATRTEALAVALARVDDTRRRDRAFEAEVEEIVAALVSIDDAFETLAHARSGLRVDALAVARAIVARSKPAARATWREVEAMAEALVFLADQRASTPPPGSGLPKDLVKVPVIPAPVRDAVPAVLAARAAVERSRYTVGERHARAAFEISLETLSQAWQQATGAADHG